MAVGINALVDADSGLVNRRIFSDEEIYHQELERIFACCWLFLTDLLTNRIAQVNTKHNKYAYPTVRNGNATLFTIQCSRFLTALRRQ